MNSKNNKEQKTWKNTNFTKANFGKGKMIVNKISWQTKLNSIKQIERKKLMRIANLEIPLKQTITWAALSYSNKIYLRQKDNKLQLVGYSNNESRLNFQKEREIQLLNPEAKVLIIPEDFFCQAAKEALEKIENRLLLMIANYKGNKPFNHNGMKLEIGIDPKTNLTYGILVLNY